MTWAPAPTAKRSSVPDGDSDTTRVGRFLTTTSPLAAWIVTGNAPALGLAAASGARTAARAATRTRERRSTNPPFREGFGCPRRAAGLLTRGSLPHRLPRPKGPVACGGEASPLTAAGPAPPFPRGPPPPPRFVPRPYLGGPGPQ